MQSQKKAWNEAEKYPTFQMTRFQFARQLKW